MEKLINERLIILTEGGMKKKWILSIIIVILAAGILAGTVYQVKEHYAYDFEQHCLIVKKDKQSGFAYAVYEDHVELLDYQGQETDVNVPETLMGKPVTVIGQNCFSATDVTSVYLSANIKELKESAFSACQELEYVAGDADLESIPTGAFRSCGRLKTVKVGNRIKHVGASAFFACEKLESIGEQPYLESIGKRAFAYAGPLSEVYVPENTEVGDTAFYGSKWLDNQTEEFAIVGKGSLVAYRGSERILEIPYGITKIDGFAFDYCENAENIREIYLPDTVEELASRAFATCQNITVYIPESVTAIDEDYWDSESSSLCDKDATIKIVTTKGSYAEEYAKTYNIPCEIVEGW